MIRTSRSSIALKEAAVDVREAAVTAHAQLEGGPPVPPASLLAELLPGWYDDWVIIERERLRQLCLEATEQMAESLLRRGRHHQAVEAALALVAAEPLREPGHRILIDAYVLGGNRAAALRHFDLCTDLLERELGLGPGPSLRSAAARARATTIPSMPELETDAWLPVSS